MAAMGSIYDIVELSGQQWLKRLLSCDVDDTETVWRSLPARRKEENGIKGSLLNPSSLVLRLIVRILTSHFVSNVNTFIKCSLFPFCLIFVKY